ncbi:MULTISPECIES: hypothetical protein, partial [Mesorhizobium]|uniref:hypothetical protein n=1 Tax=Mesorhizobium TaxID=68287 RepID=UPI0018CD56C2
MAVEWTVTIEGKNEFGDVCRRVVRIDKSWERLYGGEIGLSIDDGRKLARPDSSRTASSCCSRSKGWEQDGV